MRGYNLYYKNKKINTRLINKKQLDELLQHGHITFVNKINHERIIIPTNEITYIKCIMI